MKQRWVSIFMTFALLLSLVPTVGIPAGAATAEKDTTATVGSYTIVVPKGAEIPDTSEETSVTAVNQLQPPFIWGTESNSSWYVVEGTVTISGEVSVTVTGNVNLILVDGASLTISVSGDGDNPLGGIHISDDSSLTIYGQTGGSGVLNVTGTSTKEEGGTDTYGIKNASGKGSVIINGGTVTVNGSSTNDGRGYGIYSGSVTINGGTVTANGTGSSSGYGIYSSSSITINGGTVTANGTGTGSSSGYGSSYGIYSNSSSITISGGTVESTGTTKAFSSSPIIATDKNLYTIAGETKATATKVESVSTEKYVGVFTPVEYLDSSGNKKSCQAYTVVSSSTNTWNNWSTTSTIDGTWYVVNSNVTISDGGDDYRKVHVTGDVNLILVDGCTLTVTMTGNQTSGELSASGIEIQSEKSLTIYGQTKGTGTLKASSNNNGAGYGEGIYVNHALTINGGTVTADGSSTSGIGYGISGKNITIHGGTVTATGTGNEGSSGIYGYGDSGIVIKGGTVKAKGTTRAVQVSQNMPLDIASPRTITGAVETYTPDTEFLTNDTSSGKEYVTIHIHAFTYSASADGKTLTATCSAAGCETKASITLTAVNADYTGSAYIGASLDKTAWEDAGLTAPAIQYEGRAGTTYGVSTTAPTNAGSYTAKITAGDKTASAEYTIARAEQTISAPTASVVTQNSVTLNAISGLFGAVTYAMNTTDVAPETGWKTEDEGGLTWSDLTGGTEYHFFAKVAGDANHKEAASTGTAIGTNATVTLDTQGGNAMEPVIVAYNELMTKPADPTRTNYNFTGWFKGSDCKEVWNFGGDKVTKDMTLYAGWVEESKPVTESISGKVVKSDGITSVIGATVELWQGSTKLAATVTNSNGGFTFQNLVNGTYNVKVKTDGGLEDTELFTVPDNNEKTITLKTHSTVVNANDTAAVVDGLKNVDTTSNETVTFTIKDEPKSDTNSDQQKITRIASGKTLQYFDMTLTGGTEDIGSTNNTVLTIITPYDTTKSGITAYRCHDNAAVSLTRDAVKPTAPEDGHYYLDTGAGQIYIYAKKFSTYAVGYDTPVESILTTTYSGDSSNRATSYSVQTVTEGIGTVSVDKQFAIAGNKVTFTADPLPGWTLEGVTAKDENGTEVTLTEDAESGTYTFHMPAANVVISVHFANPIATTQDTAEDTAQPSTEDTTQDTAEATAQDTICSGFSDVDVDAWYHAGVHFCLEKGYMNGVETTLFAPDDTLSRSMIVTMLWRMLGSPVANCAMSFADIPSDEWYTEAIRWAQSAGVVQGYDDTTFGPNDPVTREELAAILYRIAESRGEGFTGASMFPFNPVDGATISDWAQEPMRWCCMTGILNGDDTGALRPIGDSTRAEAANMVQRFCEAIAE